MLKLEKKSKNHEIHVTLRESGRLLTPPFLTALGVSFAIHFFGMLLFHVTPFTIGQVETLFPPVKVQIDFQPQLDSGVLAELEIEKTRTHPISPPAVPTLRISPLKTVIPGNELTLPKMLGLSGHPFKEAEARLYYQDFITLSPPKKPLKHPYQIKITGPLHTRKMTIPKNLEEDISTMQGEHLFCGVYHIKVDDHTGKVIWTCPISGRDRRKVHGWIDKIFAAMSFEKKPTGFISEGDVEIEIRVPKQGL